MKVRVLDWKKNIEKEERDKKLQEELNLKKDKVEKEISELQKKLLGTEAFQDEKTKSKGIKGIFDNLILGILGKKTSKDLPEKEAEEEEYETKYYEEPPPPDEEKPDKKTKKKKKKD